MIQVESVIFTKEKNKKECEKLKKIEKLFNCT